MEENNQNNGVVSVPSDYVLGIDLGTTNSVLATVNIKPNGDIVSKVVDLPRAVDLYNSASGQAKLSSQKKPLLPSCVYYNEKHNFVKFIYSELGRQFILYAVYSLNKDSYKTPGLYVPKVDWTRSWTVEEILKEYDYTEEEIKKVMEDLKNFKGMED